PSRLFLFLTRVPTQTPGRSDALGGSAGIRPPRVFAPLYHLSFAQSLDSMCYSGGYQNPMTGASTPGRSSGETRAHGASAGGRRRGMDPEGAARTAEHR